MVRTPSVHDPRGIVAAETASLGLLMFALAGVVFALVVLLLLAALFRRRASAGDLTRQLTDSRLVSVGSTSFIVLGGLALPVVVLAPLLVFTLQVTARIATPPEAAALTVEVVGHQYWWEVRYPDFTTANELHVPVGTTVRIELRSDDVIHSFWVPQLLGKHDLVPGRRNHTWLRADQPGVFRGECAELCGVQHARMYFFVVAEPQAAFDQWLDRQRQPARTSADAAAQRGAGAFAREGCIDCHAIRFGSLPTGGQTGRISRISAVGSPSAQESSTTIRPT